MRWAGESGKVMTFLTNLSMASSSMCETHVYDMTNGIIISTSFLQCIQLMFKYVVLDSHLGSMRCKQVGFIGYYMRLRETRGSSPYTFPLVL